MGATNDARPLVVLTHPLPEWLRPELQDIFDFRLFDPDCPDCRSARALLTPGNLPVSNDLLDRLPALRHISSIGSGCEGLDIDYAARRGITVTNSASATAEDVADHTVALILGLNGRLIEMDRRLRNGLWQPADVFRRSLRDMPVGIVGLGAIGLATARRLTAFGCHISWTGPRPKSVPYPYVADLADLAARTDILIVAARADRSNIGLIDRAIIDRIGPSGMLVNVSRGSIVDEDALVAALREGRLGGAALDVFQSEPVVDERWRDVPNMLLTPHVGGMASGIRNDIPQLLTCNLKSFFTGSEPAD